MFEKILVKQKGGCLGNTDKTNKKKQGDNATQGGRIAENRLEKCWFETEL